MRKRFITITLTLCMLLLVAAPATVFAGTSCSKTNNTTVKTATTLNNSCGNYTNLLKQYCNSSTDVKGTTTCNQDAIKDYVTKYYTNSTSKNCANTSTNCTGSNCSNEDTNTDCTGSNCPNTGNNTNTNNGNTNTNNGNTNTNNGNTNTNNGNTNNNSGSIGSYEQQVADIVNQERAAAGLSPLTVNTNLSAVAEKKAEDMRDNGYFSHTSPTYGSPFDMMKQFGITYTAAGENIAKGQKTPTSVMSAWMNSSGHKANILSSSYNQIGVGYVTDSNGTTYWVQMFIK